MSKNNFLGVKGISVGHGPTQVLKGLDLSIRKGEFVALPNSSDWGKTTVPSFFKTIVSVFAVVEILTAAKSGDMGEGVGAARRSGCLL